MMFLKRTINCSPIRCAVKALKSARFLRIEEDDGLDFVGRARLVSVLVAEMPWGPLRSGLVVSTVASSFGLALSWKS